MTRSTVNPINGAGLNVVSVDGSLGFGRNAMNLLWENLLGQIPIPHPDPGYGASPKVVRYIHDRVRRDDDEEIKQAINTTQIGLLLTFDGIQFAQAHDRSDHGFHLKASNFKMHADYLVSDFKTVVEYELQNFKVETLEEEANEAVKN